MSMVMGDWVPYSHVLGLFLLVALLVAGSLGLVRSLLLLAKTLPLATEDLADLTFRGSVR